MGSSRYIGRVGALAVVLGVGTVVVFPQTALADDGANESPGASSQPASDASADPAAVARTETNVDQPKVVAADSTTATAPATDEHGVGSGSPSSTVSAQTNTGTSTQTSTGSTTSPTSSPTVLPETPTAPAAEDTTTSEVVTPITPVETSTPRTTAIPDDAPTPKPTSASAKPAVTAIAAATPSNSTAASVDAPAALRSLRVAVPAPQSNVTNVAPLSARVDLAASPTTPVPAIASDPLSALLAVPVSIVSALVNAFLTPLFGNPAAPAQPPLLWAVLGWVRREFDRTFFNSTPTAPTQNVTITLKSPTATSGSVAFAAADADGDPMAYAVSARGTVGGPLHGTVTVDQATGTFTYDPDDAYVLTGGTDGFTYTVSDAAARPTFFGIPLSSSSATATGTVVVTLNRVEVAPIVNGDNRSTAEDTPISIAVLGNDTDANGDQLTVTAVTQPTHGTSTFTASGVTYAPNANFNGTDTFAYTAGDGSATATATVTVTVTSVDDAPVAVDDTATVAEDSSTSQVDVLANDTDVDGGTKTITAVTQPANGSVTSTGTAVLYTPNANFNGADTFTYTINGGTTATVTLTVTAVDDAPVAVDDTAAITEDSLSVVIPVLANDTDIDAGPKTITAVTQPAHGTVTFTATTLRYTPTANYNGTDTFRYTLAGGSTATVYVTVTPVNDAPVLGQPTSTPGVGNTWVITTNATDVDGDALTTTVKSTDSTPLTVTRLPGGGLQVVVDPTWASAHPGAQLPVTVTVTDPQNASATKSLVIGTASNVTAIGYNSSGQANIPALPAGVTYTQVAVSLDNTVLLRSDGTAIAVGDGYDGQLDIPQLPPGITYTQVAVGASHTVLLRSNGTAVAVGSNDYGQLNIPALPPGVTYTRVFAGEDGTVLIRSDGTAVAVGSNDYGQLNIPALPTGVTYTQAAVGYYHTVLLRSDGIAVALGYNGFGQLDIPALPAGVKYTQVAAGEINTLLLRSDGTAVAVGNNTWGQSTIPALPAGVTYTRVAAARYNSALLRSDGTAVAFGQNDSGQLNIPVLPAGVTYTQAAASNHTVLISSTTAAALNAPPVAANDTLTVSEGATTTISVTANDTDSDGTIDSATVVITRQPVAGSVTVNTGGTVTYASNGTEVTADSFAYRVNDNKGASSNEATVSITITAVNDAPVAVGDSYSTNANTVLTVPVRGVLFNDTDAEGNSLTSTLVTGPSHGALTLDPNGSFVYTPAAGYSGPDGFTYTAKDTTGATSNTATVTITIAAANTPPVAVNDAATVAEGGTASITLTANDTDVDGTINPASIVVVRPPTAGTVTVNTNGTVTYASNGAEVTTDSFTYTVRDNAGATSDAATVTITITPVNDAPIAGPDVYTVAGNGTLTVTTPGLLANDSDAEGSPVFIAGAFSPQHGTLSSVFSGGGFTYRPNTGYAGPDSFTYTISDGTTTSLGTVSITVTATLNQAPVGSADSYTVTEDGTLTINAPGILGNDSDAEGQPLSVTSIGVEPTHGSLELRSDGSFDYTPAANFNGTDTFSYRASDGSAETALTTVTITVTAVNDAPVAANDTIPIAKDSFVAFTLANRSSDVDGDTLTATLITGTQHGTLFFDGVQRAFTYKPVTGFTGQDSFTYKVNDGTIDSAVATVTLVVS